MKGSEMVPSSATGIGKPNAGGLVPGFRQPDRRRLVLVAQHAVDPDAEDIACAETVHVGGLLAEHRQRDGAILFLAPALDLVRQAMDGHGVGDGVAHRGAAAERGTQQHHDARPGPCVAVCALNQSMGRHEWSS